MHVKQIAKGVLTYPDGHTREWTQPEILDIVCNKCGMSRLKHDKSRYAASMRYYGGFESIGAIGDSVGYAFDLCETCLASLMDTFKHSALIETEEGDD